ncbi:carbon catabolite repressor protein 4 homolog 6 [Oryza glaberrima]|uniref:Endonuclease/exonuclease/phosphatase domain-containing protein n=1 Tax=Oryza glaberrima TaxID=4538 RepID=I1NPK1_ORYGL|nr:carbon catabolite repressor protein 4 homolog 6 [Oryza glaberrima]
MRLASRASLRRAAAMSAYYNARGSARPRRGYYSGRPTPPPHHHHDAGAELVSGDSHHSAVRAANDSLRRGGGRGPPPSPYGYAPPQPPPALYGAVPYNYGPPPPQPQDPQYGYATPNPYVQGHPQPYWRGPTNAGFRPPYAGFRPGAPQQSPRLAEYRRRWRFTQHRPPRQAERFKVLSYNILADYLAQEHQFLYERIPSFIMDWNWRKEKLVFEFGLWSPDILCLQEVDKFTDLEQEMATRGYNGIWKMRTGNATDGCAIFWRTARFQLRYQEDIEFNKIDLRDNVAQICVLESVIPGNVQTESSPNHPQQAKQIVVCNTHVLYNPKRGDIKLGQVRTLLDRVYALSKTWNDAPVIICGDFNSTPKSPLYNFMLEQKLNLSGLVKSNISGQQTSTAQGLYTGPNTARFYPPFHTTNSKEGSISYPNDHKPQPEARNVTENSRLSGREPTLTDTASDSFLNPESSTNPHEQELMGCVKGPTKEAYTSDAEAHTNTTNGEETSVVNNSSEGYGVIKKSSVEGTNVTNFSSASTTVNDETLQSDSSEIVDRSQLLPSYESSESKDSWEELAGGSNNSSNTLANFPGHVISGKATCDFERNNVQSDTLFDISKVRPDEKEQDSEPLSTQNNCMRSESKSNCFSDPLKFADTLHQMSNLRLEEENNTEPTQLTSPLEPLQHTDCAFSDTCDVQCTPEVINRLSKSHSCSNKLGNCSCAFEDDGASNEVLCSDVNADPSIFKEFSGVNESLLEDEDQLQTTSDGSPSAQQVITSDKRYYDYDPYRWTPDEIKAATGNEDCIFVEHNLKVRSVYTDVEDFEGTKDANKEPLVTSYNRKFMGTVDYIWASEDLQTVQVLDTFPKEILKQTIGFPTKKWGSDHIALVCELAFTK